MTGWWGGVAAGAGICINSFVTSERADPNIVTPEDASIPNFAVKISDQTGTNNADEAL